MVGVAPEEEPATGQAVPRFLLLEDVERAVRGVGPAEALENGDIAGAPARISTGDFFVVKAM